ncbi:hypothetical protein [Saccharibacillus alkalitolerans]|uniref:Uncharacterized protein n=1 Tax=Saccharibacillus alkalitolerans TaxID=2705290 RepID=A0ABX0F2S0_9BACL|nr:hypothetical protein [Saccharibacillus alkalitolerans]NGZ73953.1 hypothetical protein [Saccharibacillus alkalitolerans]
MERMGQFNRRRGLRRELLGRLYDSWFERGGEPCILSGDEINGETEKKLAYRYLAEKGMVRMSPVGDGSFEVSITVQGIDRIEMTGDNE